MFVLSVLIYLPALKGQPLWADNLLLSGKLFGDNSVKSALTHPYAGWFRPITALTFVFDTSYAHYIPFYYHQTNLILHAGTAVLVSCLTFAVTQSRRAGVLAGLFFAGQPMQVAATSWISARPDALAAFFIAGFLVCLVQFHRTSGFWWIVFAIVSYLLAILSKEQSIPILLAVPFSFSLLGGQRGKIRWVVNAIFCCITGLYVVGLCVYTSTPHFTSDTVRSIVWLCLRTFAFYAVAMLVPNHGSLITFTLAHYQAPIGIAIGAILLVCLGILWVWQWRKRSAWAWLIACAVLLYLPIANFPPSISLLVTPYRMSLPGVLTACLLGGGLAIATQQKRWPIALLFTANLVMGFAVTTTGTTTWQSASYTFREIVNYDPNFVVGADLEANTLTANGHADQAVQVLSVPLKYLFGSNQWQSVLEANGSNTFTDDVKERAREMGGPYDPRSIATEIGDYAFALARTNHILEACKAVRAGLAIWPVAPSLNYIYGKLTLQTNRADAMNHWEIAMQTDPGYAPCAAALGHELLKDHDFARAAQMLNQALPTMATSGQVWLDLCDADIELRKFIDAKRALSQSQQTMFPPSADAIKSRADRITQLELGTPQKVLPAR